MEYADNGDLFQKICEHQKKGTEFQETEIWKVFIQVVKAMKALHDMRIMHRDLKVTSLTLINE
jgi:NIMA (never in mitosis gene a)-related kinase